MYRPCLNMAFPQLRILRMYRLKSSTWREKRSAPACIATGASTNRPRKGLVFRKTTWALIYQKLLEADGILVASPVHFGRLSGLTADWMDRTRAFVHGKIYQMPLKNKVGGAMAVAFFRGAGLETTLSSLDLFFLTHQMILANSRLYQLGAGAFSSREGKGRFEKDIRHMTLEDEVGVLSARMLVERVIDLARIIKAGTLALPSAV